MIVVFVVIQVVPLGRTHSNPAVTGEPKWANPRFVPPSPERVSGATATRWTGRGTPISPRSRGRSPIMSTTAEEVVNFSEFDRSQPDARDAVEVVEEGSMPPEYYTRFGLHSTAKLTDAERQQLVAGLRATPGLSH